MQPPVRTRRRERGSWRRPSTRPRTKRGTQPPLYLSTSLWPRPWQCHSPLCSLDTGSRASGLSPASRPVPRLPPSMLCRRMRCAQCARPAGPPAAASWRGGTRRLAGAVRLGGLSGLGKAPSVAESARARRQLELSLLRLALWALIVTPATPLANSTSASSLGVGVRRAAPAPMHKHATRASISSRLGQRRRQPPGREGA